MSSLFICFWYIDFRIPFYLSYFNELYICFFIKPNFIVSCLFGHLFFIIDVVVYHKLLCLEFVWIHVCCVLLFCIFFFHAFSPTGGTVHIRYMNSSHNFWPVFMHCSRTHKFHFLSIFSLKMGLTTLFTHLKIILLQCFQFSVFSFSKISSIQTDP